VCTCGKESVGTCGINHHNPNKKTPMARAMSVFICVLRDCIGQRLLAYVLD